ncbi:MAG: Holliday junction branch migration DNA helicase RuvB, partial [Candidatus Adiutrix sp.]|nr:Holliday junction branch migration DNA helicase RuvB [Candidatus Adiutrix sp.]
TLATVVAEEPDTILEVYEPFLIQEGFIHRTPRGRVATARAYRHLALTPPETLPSSSAGENEKEKLPGLFD